ncbi:MAG: UvrD-helicase domain-containing protein, partial [Planctomycetota bacterium]
VWSLPDPQQWQAETTAALAGLVDADWSGSSVATLMTRVVRRETPDLRALAATAREALAAAASEPKLEKLSEIATAWAEVAHAVGAALHADDLRQAKARFAKPTGSLAGGKRGELRDHLVAATNAIRDAFKAEPLTTVLSFDDDIWQRGLRLSVPATQTFVRLLEALQRRYAAEKRRLRSLDFNDLEHTALDLLRTRPDVQADVHRRYRHVLIDEAQDLNAVQHELVKLLTPSTAEATTFVVGDVKQSIYGFRHAEPKRFLARLADADGATVERVDLRENFRSWRSVIDAVNAAMHRLMSDEEAVDLLYDERQSLVAAGEQTGDEPGDIGGPAEVVILPADPETDENSDGDDDDTPEQAEREAAYVAGRIQTWLAEKRQVHTSDGRVPFEPRHAVVLMRSPKFDGARFASTMRRAGVPCRSETGGDLLTSLEVMDVLAVLRLIDNPRRDLELATYLRSPLAGLADEVEPADVLGRIRAADSDGTFAEATRAFADSDESDAESVATSLATLTRWQDAAGCSAVGDLVRSILRETAYPTYLAGRPDGERRRANLQALVHLADTFDQSRRGAGVGEFVLHVEALAGVAEPVSAGQSDDAVRVMSIHASKGLEFPVVFLVGCGKRFNRRSHESRVLVHPEVGIALPACEPERRIRFASPQSFTAKRLVRASGLAEELRLLYVAMTRARSFLCCVGHAKDVQAALTAGDRFAPVDRLSGRDVLAGESFATWLLAAAAGRSEFAVMTPDAGDLAGRSDERRQALSDELLARRSIEPDAPPDEPTRRVLRRLSVDLRGRTDWRRASSRPIDRLLSEAGLASYDALVAIARGAEAGTEEQQWMASLDVLAEARGASDCRTDVPILLPTGKAGVVRRGRVAVLYRDVNHDVRLVDIGEGDLDAATQRARRLAAAVARITGRTTHATCLVPTLRQTAHAAVSVDRATSGRRPA